MSKKIIKTAQAPAAIGPYSQGIFASGETCYVSGQLPIDPTTGAFAGEDIRTQTRQSLENIKAILSQSGMQMSDVVQATVLLQHIDDFDVMNEVYAEYFFSDCPARAAFEVAALPKAALVEIQAIAVK
jgi:2-iminobutanoate/2-iminopropanoate deaminase